jgi:glycosyltransferase involved in cell wall biosynthesis
MTAITPEKKQRKKVAFLIRDLHYGGAERQLITLVKGLNPANFDLTILTFYPGGSLESELADTTVQLISLDKQHRWDVVGFFGRLVRQLQQINPDVLHGYLGTPNLFTILLKPWLPSTHMIWGFRSAQRDGERVDWLERVLFPIESCLARFAHLIIVNSYAGQSYCRDRGFPTDKIVVIANGIDTQRFRPDPVAREKIRTEWGIAPNTVLIGRVGRLELIKDHSTFLKAAALLCQDQPNVHFVCVGNGPSDYRQALYQLAVDLGIGEKVIWAGARSDLPAIHNALDIAVSSSLGEGFPNVLGEAMACGVPCVVTNVGDSAHIVGEMGIVVPPKDPAALKAGMQQLIDRLSQQACDRNSIRQWVVDHFSVWQLIHKTESTLLNLSYD